ncbi:hypothetical protein EV699_11411 [Plasticicumulans lactativorans]|uniref:PhoX family phosphatase n=1 Tax=Plasticicumulans lactativorans TaxID=1133106 RepID=A0A4R2L536_9GAMM|nr:PhoX family phosphatase [Plasticicumulans lactativorans]TCO80367.1 hypothetical protein EV699_11411 [Plasticicumulans lactativorans]
MSKIDDGIVSNDSANPHFGQLLAARLSRRTLLGGSLGAAALGFLGIDVPAAAAADAVPAGSTGPAAAGPAAAALLGFTGIAASTEDTVRVPAGYRWQVIARWGDPIGALDAAPGTPAFRTDAGNSAEEQALQVGMHNDGMHYFTLPWDNADAAGASRRGLLVINHEYVDQGLLYPDGMQGWSADKVRKSQHAHGVSVLEIVEQGGEWRIVPQSGYARRITANTPMRIGGPAAGHPLLCTAADPEGRQVLGTFNNCANGYTPWGTYLTCEENFNGYFVAASVDADLKRYGVKDRSDYRWHEHDARFDAGQHPHEPNRFGWVVEIDPYAPDAVPVKRTALGRIKHEGATVTTAADGRVVVYMGDDQAGEYIYKFVSRDAWDATDRLRNRHLLDHGTLYVARFEADGGGRWLPLVHGADGLVADKGFADQGEVLVRTRQAADVLGATRMDRPEWIACHPQSGEVYCSLTNNTGRADARPNDPNPRDKNVHGHIIRWRERGDAAAEAFAWDVFVLAGDPASEVANNQGNVTRVNPANTDVFSAPDGLWVDPRGVLWIETDVSTSRLYHPELNPKSTELRNIGNNQLLAADPASKAIRRFLTGPVGCEITGITMTPDLRTLFVNVQHPGEPLGDSEFNDPAKPMKYSTWPDGPAGGRPRSATVVITRTDGGVIGS